MYLHIEDKDKTIQLQGYSVLISGSQQRPHLDMGEMNWHVLSLILLHLCRKNQVDHLKSADIGCT